MDYSGELAGVGNGMDEIEETPIVSAGSLFLREIKLVRVEEPNTGSFIGYNLTIGCKSFHFINENDVKEFLIKYILNPEKFEIEYNQIHTLNERVKSLRNEIKRIKQLYENRVKPSSDEVSPKVQRPL